MDIYPESCQSMNTLYYVVNTDQCINKILTIINRVTHCFLINLC